MCISIALFKLSKNSSVISRRLEFMTIYIIENSQEHKLKGNIKERLNGIKLVLSNIWCKLFCFLRNIDLQHSNSKLIRIPFKR
jgi:hypothetical protein